MRHGLALFAIVLLIGYGASAAVHKVRPGESIQAAIDAAAPGDTILVGPGTYQETGNGLYGLRIATDDLRLIGMVDDELGAAGRVRLLQNESQETGIYAAPAGCEYKGTSCPSVLNGFYVRGFTVEGFPQNGIQTRWVDGFQFVRNESVNNLNNGIYPTLSLNGLVQENVSYGSLDTAMWIAGSENVRVIGNDVSGSPIGLEITVANNVWVTQNRVHDNTVGIGLFHPNAAGNPPHPVMANWVIEHNDIRNNNLPNPAPAGSFQRELPSGVGVLLLGVSDHVIAKNVVEDNDFVGIGVLEWCSATITSGTRNCFVAPPIWDPSASRNFISQNVVNRNGGNPPGGLFGALAADITFFDLTGASSGNCFEKNKPDTRTEVSSDPSGALPTDGC